VLRAPGGARSDVALRCTACAILLCRQEVLLRPSSRSVSDLDRPFCHHCLM